MAKRPKVKPSGSAVFVPQTGEPRTRIPVGGVVLVGRFPRATPLRPESDDSYAGGQKE